jgi:site-specific recombinase XerD
VTGVATAEPVTKVQPTGLTILDQLPFYETSLRASGKSTKTVLLYANELRKLHAYLKAQGMPLDVGLVRREHLEAWIVSLVDRGLKEASVSIAYRSIRPFWTWLVDEDDIDASPMTNMKQPKVHVEARTFPSNATVEQLLATCDGRDFEDRRDRAIILLLFDTGIRRGELTNLRVDDVDVASGFLRVIGKARRHRSVALTPVVAVALARYLKVRSKHPRAAAPAFWLGKKGELTGSAVLQMFRRRGALIGFPKLGPHQLRHAFAHNALADGMAEGDVMRIAGWTTPDMLRRYGAAQAEERALEAHRAHSAASRLRMAK